MTTLTESQIDAIQNSGLHRRTPHLIGGVTQTQFSVARFYGGCKFNGDEFTYFPHTDELVRNDVLKWIKKQGTK